MDAYRDCEECGDRAGPGGCFHDGHAFCAACLHCCGQCRAAMRDDFYAEQDYR